MSQRTWIVPWQILVILAGINTKFNKREKMKPADCSCGSHFLFVSFSIRLDNDPERGGVWVFIFSLFALKPYAAWRGEIWVEMFSGDVV